ncbi:SGNH/GDSL hydrolase family protein [Herbaspirillum robiniae]|uniref:SGNH/GDSL hydrolase family protein n=1 Tax=Herbaspirillum robiniae TaxID=2014887 RepID=A0ABX2LUC8_9BURK|nr:SGNH/GDSL hydrolase family protein [Herbaspirillum robiniae]NUU02135.1 SGNH/GDSL hydrolase family protein [Herbaspirillum robiniae]
MLILAKILLGPLLLAQGKWLRKTALRLPEAAGPRLGVEHPPGAAAAAPAEALRLLVVGDSSAAGVGVEHQEQALALPLARHLAARSGRAVAWQLVAQSGVNSLEALDLLARHEIGPAAVLVVALGTNDVTSQMPPRQYVANLRLLAERLMARAGVAHIVFTGLPPLHTLPAAPQPLRWYLGRYARKLDSALRAWIAQDPTLRYCSLQWALPHEMAIDKFHPGHGQYAQWARMAAEIIESGLAGGAGRDGAA